MTETMHDQLRKRLAIKGMNPNQASIAAGLSRGYLQTVFNREHEGGGAAASQIAKLAPVLGTTVDWLINGSGPEEPGADIKPPINEAQPIALAPSAGMGPAHDVPVYGLAAGSIRGALTMTNDPIEWVEAPKGVLKIRDAYSLIITGTSMLPLYTPGEKIFIAPHRPIRLGDHIIIQEALDGGTATSVKRFEKQSEDHVFTTQYNPLAEIRFSRKAIIAMHRVLTANEVAGV